MIFLCPADSFSLDMPLVCTVFAKGLIIGESTKLKEFLKFSVPFKLCLSSSQFLEMSTVKRIQTSINKRNQK